MSIGRAKVASQTTQKVLMPIRYSIEISRQLMPMDLFSAITRNAQVYAKADQSESLDRLTSPMELLILKHPLFMGRLPIIVMRNNLHF